MPQTKTLLSSITSTGNKLPARIIIHAVSGWGKTSLAAMFPDPIFIEARGETGLETLIDAGQLPETPHFPEIMTWEEILKAIQELTNDEHSYQTVVFDTMDCTERLCHDYVTKTDYRGDSSETGFMSYRTGYKIAANRDWYKFLSLLDQLRAHRKMRIILLSHTKPKRHNNTEGPDYDSLVPNVHPDTWEITGGWADLVLFGNYYITVKKEKGEQRNKAKGGRLRLLHTNGSTAFEAKHRHGLPDEIVCGNTPQETYDNFVSAMIAGKEKKNAA